MRAPSAKALLSTAAAAATLAAGVIPVGVADGASAQHRFFLSPSGNISCELDLAPSVKNGTEAYCQTMTPPRSTSLSPTGTVKACNGPGCLGNPPENAATLGYGKSIRLGPYTCTSLTVGVRCTISSGAGFLISRSGVQKLR